MRVANILLDLNNRDSWSKVYSKSFTASAIPGTNKFTPISPLRLTHTFDKHILAIGASSFQTRPTWRTGFWLSMYVDVPSIGKAEGYNKSIPLGLSIVIFPVLSPTYNLIITIPKWHKEMTVEIWQYTGSVEDIKSDLDRIEQKIDTLYVQ